MFIYHFIYNRIYLLYIKCFAGLSVSHAQLYSHILCKFAVRRFQPLSGNLYPKEEKRFTAQIWGSGAIPSYCTIFPISYCLYCTTNRCSLSSIPPLFSAKNIPQYRSQLLPTCHHLPTCQQLPACESFNKLLLPRPTHKPPPAGQHTGRKRFPIV